MAAKPRKDVVEGIMRGEYDGAMTRDKLRGLKLKPGLAADQRVDTAGSDDGPSAAGPGQGASNWLGDDAVPVDALRKEYGDSSVLRTANLDDQFEHRGLKGLKLKPDVSAKVKTADSAAEDDARPANWLGDDAVPVDALRKEYGDSSVLRTANLDDQFEHRGLKGLKIKPEPRTSAARKSSGRAEEDAAAAEWLHAPERQEMVQEFGDSRVLQTANLDDQFEHRGLKGLKIKETPKPRRSSGAHRATDRSSRSGHASDRDAADRGSDGLASSAAHPSAGALPAAAGLPGAVALANRAVVAGQSLDHDVMDDSDMSGDDDDDDLEAGDWLAEPNAAPRDAMDDSSDSGSDGEVMDDWLEEGPDKTAPGARKGDPPASTSASGMFEAQGDISGGGIVGDDMAAGVLRTTTSDSGTAKSGLTASSTAPNYADFDDEWEHLKTLKLVFQKAGLERRQQQRFLEALVPERLSEGEYVVRQGEDGDKFYIITEGEVMVTKTLTAEEAAKLPESKLRRLDDGGAEMRITYLYDGHFFGETSLYTDDKRNANVIVSSNEAAVMSMAKEKFRPFLDEDAKFRELILQLIERKREAARKRDEYLKRQGVADTDTGREQREHVKVSKVRVKRKTDDGKVILNDYVLQHKVGQGAYGTVWLAMAVTDAKKYAIKMVNRDRLKKKGRFARGAGEGDEELLNEVAAMKKLAHPNLVKLYEVIDEPQRGKFYMVQEYMALGAIMDEVEYSEPFEPEVARAFFRQMVSGIAYMHFQGVIHRDLKPSNVLVGEGGVCKIADFGTVAIIDEQAQAEAKLPADWLTGVRGTAAFQPPEVFLLEPGQGYRGHAVDMWALGATLHQMVVGSPPFMGRNELELVEILKRGEFRVAIEVQLDPHLKNLLQGLLEVDVDRRYTLDQVAEHDWVTAEGTEPLLVSGFRKLALIDSPKASRRSSAGPVSPAADADDGAGAVLAGGQSPFPVPEGAPDELGIVASETVATSYQEKRRRDEQRIRALRGKQGPPASASQGGAAVAAALVAFSSTRTSTAEDDRDDIASGSADAAVARATMLSTTPAVSTRRGSGGPMDEIAEAAAREADEKLRVTLAGTKAKAHLRAMRNRQLRLIKEHATLTDKDRDILLDQQRFAISSTRADVEVVSVRVDAAGRISDEVMPRSFAGSGMRSMHAMRRPGMAAGDVSRPPRHSQDLGAGAAAEAERRALRTADARAPGSGLGATAPLGGIDGMADELVSEHGSRKNSSSREGSFAGIASSGDQMSDDRTHSTLSRLESERRIGSLQRKKDFVMVTSNVEGDEDGGKVHKKVIFRAKDPSLSLFSGRAGTAASFAKKRPPQGGGAKVKRGSDGLGPLNESGALTSASEDTEDDVDETDALAKPLAGDNVDLDSYKRRAGADPMAEGDEGSDDDFDDDDGDDDSDYGDIETVDDMEHTAVGGMLQSLFQEITPQAKQEDDELEDLTDAEEAAFLKAFAAGLVPGPPHGCGDVKPSGSDSSRDSPGPRRSSTREPGSAAAPSSPADSFSLSATPDTTPSGAASSSAAASFGGDLLGDVTAAVPPSHNAAIEADMSHLAGRSVPAVVPAGGVCEDLGLIFAAADAVGRRSAMEDRHMAVLDAVAAVAEDGAEGRLLKPGEAEAAAALAAHPPPRTALFAVFDGHNGSGTSEFLSQRLATAVTLDPAFSSDLEACLTSAADRVDNEYMDHAEANQVYDGATGVIIAIRQAATTKAGGRRAELVCANVGDSRAVLSRRGEAVELSSDHKCTREDEEARIKAAGGWIAKGRLCGVIAVTRSFGDIEHKRLKDACWDIKFTGDTLIAQPEFRRDMVSLPAPRAAHSSWSSDEFIIVACDGVWDVMTSQQAVSFVRRRVAEHADAGLAAQELVRKALDLNTIDNCTVCIVFFARTRLPAA